MTIKLKERGVGESYAQETCAVRGCAIHADLVDATHRLDFVDVPLCERHWQLLSDAIEKQKQRAEDAAKPVAGQLALPGF